MAYEDSPAAKAVFDEADAFLGFSLSNLCFTGPEDLLTDTLNQQPALFTTSIAYWQAMLEKGWSIPDFMAGHSLVSFQLLLLQEASLLKMGLLSSENEAS